jgi:magnesium chelatase accessory protein
MPAGLDWATDGAHWPHRERSRFVDAGGLRWHVQHWPRPAAPVLLLLHGAGASTHSFAKLAPLLAAHHELIVPDLPGHGFSGPAPAGAADMSGMALGVSALLRALQRPAELLVGHSAGAAVALGMVFHAQARPRAIAGINAALLPLRGLAGTFFSPAAKLLALNPLVPRFFAWRAADRFVLDRLLASTGSKVDEDSRRCYGRLIANPGHVAGTLAMMARWDLPALAAELPKLTVPLHLLVGEHDGTIPPADAARVQALLPDTTRRVLPGLGHLAHEEDPQRVADWISEVVVALPHTAAQEQA